MSNILIIPHSANKNLTIRSFEIAKNISKKHHVYYLHWYRRNSDSYISYLYEILRNFFCINRNILIKKNLTIIYMQKFYYPYRLALILNSYNIQRLIKKLNISKIINSSFYYYPIKKKNKILYIYDLPDDHLEYHAGNLSIAMHNRIKNFISEEIKKSDIVTCVSKSIYNNLISKYPNKKILIIPNGIDYKKYYNISKNNINKFKKINSLDGYFLIGYFGNLKDEYTGLDFLIEFFLLVRSKFKVKLLLAGPITAKQKKLINRTRDIKYFGHVDQSKIFLFCKSVDLGVLPFIKNKFTDNSLPFKVLENTACNIPILSTKLKTLVGLNFPNIFFAERNLKSWFFQFNQIFKKRPKYNSKKFLKQFTWKIILKKLYKFI